VKATCGSGNAVDFEVVGEENYDRTYTDIKNGRNARPLGFSKGVVRAHDTHHTNPCIEVSGIADRSIEVMFESIPSTLMCLRDQSGTNVCTEGRYQNCYDAPTENMYFEFYCDMAEGCMGSDVEFWYRFTVGPEQELDREGMWCHQRQNSFPSSLVPFRIELMSEEAEPSTDHGYTPTSCVSLIILMLSLKSAICV